jgi:predicted DNA-binding transcriptional regulator AlpA
MARTGLSRSSLYEKIKNRTFPQQKKLGVRSVGFLTSEVDAWVRSVAIGTPYIQPTCSLRSREHPDK